MALAAVVISLLIAVFVANSNDTDPPDGGNGGNGASGAPGVIPTTAGAGGNPGCEEPSGDDWHPIELGDDPTGKVTGPIGSITWRVRQARWRADESNTWLVSLETQVENNTTKQQSLGSWNYRGLIVGQYEFRIDEGGCYSDSGEGFVGADLKEDERAGFKVSCEPVGAIKLVMAFGDVQPEEEATIDVSSDTEPGACG